MFFGIRIIGIVAIFISTIISIYAWGKLISTTASLASTVGVKNPYRYRL